jgi:hypothetical protein
MKKLTDEQIRRWVQRHVEYYCDVYGIMGDLAREILAEVEAREPDYSTMEGYGDCAQCAEAIVAGLQCAECMHPDSEHEGDDNWRPKNESLKRAEPTDAEVDEMARRMYAAQSYWDADYDVLPGLKESIEAMAKLALEIQRERDARLRKRIEGLESAFDYQRGVISDERGKRLKAEESNKFLAEAETAAKKERDRYAARVKELEARLAKITDVARGVKK